MTKPNKSSEGERMKKKKNNTKQELATTQSEQFKTRKAKHKTTQHKKKKNKSKIQNNTTQEERKTHTQNPFYSQIFILWFRKRKGSHQKISSLLKSKPNP